MLKGVCLRYAKNEAEAEDLMQDSFIKAFNKLNTFKGTGALGGWIRRIGVTTALENLRKQKMILSPISNQMEETILKGNSGDEVFQNLDLEVLIAKIQSLPIGYRAVFNLFAIEGYSHKEIAKELNISIGTSKSQYSRGRSLLIKSIRADEELTEKRLNYVE